MYRTIDRLMFTLAALAPAALSAQDSVKADTAAPTAASTEPLVAHTFSLTAHERVTVTLLKDQAYRIELDGRGIRFRLKPAQAGMQKPRIQELLSGASAGGTTLSLVRPQASGEYYLETVGGDPGRPVRVTLTMQPMKKDEKS
jgi:hypothetical protein